MTRLALLSLALLAGCIPLQPDAELTRMANEEWGRCGAPAKFRGLRWVGQRCIGLPAAWTDGREQVMRVFVPWPLSGAAARAVMRYEMSKMAWQLTAVDTWPWWISWFGPIDALLHLPPSELNSWRHVIWPPDIPSENTPQ